MKNSMEGNSFQFEINDVIIPMEWKKRVNISTKGERVYKHTNISISTIQLSRPNENWKKFIDVVVVFFLSFGKYKMHGNMITLDELNSVLVFPINKKKVTNVYGHSFLFCWFYVRMRMATYGLIWISECC